MTTKRTISTAADLEKIHEHLKETAEFARKQLAEVATHPDALGRLKFEQLGCDPLDLEDPQNLCEQVDQQATYTVAAHALEILMRRHPNLAWDLAPGAHGSGHDIVSNDETVAAEVFAAVRPTNNQKLKRDIAKIRGFSGQHRYVIYRSPNSVARERIENGVTVIALESS